jgi:aerobic carbon-monoxide dehydrogenase medium subunit
MKPAPFTYHDPANLEDALDLLAGLENARPLAGGQSLVSMMNFRYAMPDHLVDLNNVPELTQLSVQDNRLRLGAMLRQREIEFSRDVAALCPILREAILNVGHRQTRNRGTVGGSLCHLDPSAELPAMMMLHDAEVVCTSKRGERSIAMQDFALGYMTPALEPDEILKEVHFALWPNAHGYAFEEYARRHGDFAIASCGVLLTLSGQQIDRLSIVIGGLGSGPQRLVEFEQSAKGQLPDEGFIERAAAAASTLEAYDDPHVSASYRKHLASVLSARALRRAIARAKEKAND